MSSLFAIRRQIERVHFSLLSEDDIKALSVVAVVRAEALDRRGQPLEGGVLDRRLGAQSPSLDCHTCGGSFSSHDGASDCPGRGRALPRTPAPV